MTAPYASGERWTLYQADALAGLPLPDASVQTCVTSPPYWGLRDYGVPGQLGLEATPAEYVEHMVAVFREVRRVLRDDGTLWLNMGDSYAASRSYQVPDSKHCDVGNSAGMEVPPGLKPKDLIGIPWRLAFALQADGWWLRCDVIWSKPNPMPESVTDRPTRAHEYLFLLTKRARYYYDADAVREACSYDGPPKPGKQAAITSLGGKDTMALGQGNPLGRNRRSVWTIPTAAFPGAHFATFPPALVEPCVRAGTSQHGCCPACGAPWGREVERSGEVDDRGGRRKHADTMRRVGDTSAFVTGRHAARRIVGWRSTCTCAAGDPVPCTVLDPFCGTATAGMVALAEGRRFVGVDLNRDYLEMARGRCVAAAAQLPLPLGRTA